LFYVQNEENDTGIKVRPAADENLDSVFGAAHQQAYEAGQKKLQPIICSWRTESARQAIFSTIDLMTTIPAGPVGSRHVLLNIKSAASIAGSNHVALQADVGFAVDREIQLQAPSTGWGSDCRLD
jgi:hypothetical protein